MCSWDADTAKTERTCYQLKPSCLFSAVIRWCSFFSQHICLLICILSTGWCLYQNRYFNFPFIHCMPCFGKPSFFFERMLRWTCVNTGGLACREQKGGVDGEWCAQPSLSVMLLHKLGRQRPGSAEMCREFSQGTANTNMNDWTTREREDCKGGRGVWGSEAHTGDKKDCVVVVKCRSRGNQSGTKGRNDGM